MKDNHVTLMKACGISLVVIGHSGFFYSDFIYLFHMSFFFILFGYTSNIDNASSDLKKLISYLKTNLKGYTDPM